MINQKPNCVDILLPANNWLVCLLCWFCCNVSVAETSPELGDKNVANDTHAASTTMQARTPLEERLLSEQLTQWNKFVITPHKPSYVLPIAYNSKQNDHLASADNLEIKFQFSVRVPLWQGFISDNGFLSLGYTQISYWQAYNSEASAEFRETNFEPELMLTFLNNTHFMDFSNRLVTIGLVHQSNGQSQLESRSWNRIYIDLVFERQNFYLSIKPWYRFPEDEKQDPLEPEGDDNPNIEKYYGYGELSGIYKSNEQTYGFMLRNNLRSGENKGAVQLDWTFPLHGRLIGYVQYFNGYGESLIDYNRYSNRLALGIMITNWL